MGPIVFILVFLALPLGTALFLAGYALTVVVARSAGEIPLAMWALIAAVLGAIAGLVVGRWLSRSGSPPW